jgi:adenosine deaminase
VNLTEYLRQMPKVELHVHLEGAIGPETLLKLAQRHQIDLPARDVAGLREWFVFQDFPHFVQIYMTISSCIRDADDIELITCEFLQGQAAQNILYTEATYTPYTHYLQKGISFKEQLAAINRARAWGEAELGVKLNLVVDIARAVTLEQGMVTAKWVVEHYGDGVVALGLGGAEVGNPPEKFAEAFAYAAQAGVPAIPHAGETVGADSIWGALKALNAIRIGHGVRCLEDAALVDELRVRQIPLEVSPTSNLCLGVYPSWAEHPLKRLIDAGLYVTLNSDDPPMFNTTLTQEYEQAVATFGFDAAAMEQFVLRAARVALLPEAEKSQLEAKIQTEFARLRAVSPAE